MKEYFISKEFVQGIKRHLFHVFKTELTHSVCIDAFENESCAIAYCDFLNR